MAGRRSRAVLDDRLASRDMSGGRSLTKPQSQFSIVDLLLLVLLFAIGAAFWTRGQYQGWAFLTFAIYFASLAYLNVRLCKPIFPTVIALLPICCLLLFMIATCASMRHPPFMVPAGWEWPPFESFGERAGHAFALCVWQVFWVPIAVLLAGFTSAIANRFGDSRRPTWFLR